MKNLGILAIYTFIAFLTITSCSNEGTINTIDENTIANRLTFLDVSERIMNAKNEQPSAKTQRDALIVEWDEWGRKSRNCGGWGLCNANWFPSANKQAQKSSTTNGSKTILEYDSSIEKYFIDILLADIVPPEIPIEALTLKIDENFELNVEDAISKNLIFNKGDYLFNTALGEYGGYRIYLD
tara:strand:- start:1215 stop:1763 length:549 start_codon:yes stop_codon:yes gene_type:complete